MILDDLSSAARYYGMHAGFRAAFEFLARPDLRFLEPGRHDIQGESIFVLVNRDMGRGRTGARLEAHRKFIDIQFLVAGSEEIGWRPTAECQRIVEPYDDNRDITFFGDQPYSWIKLPVGKFMIFYPADAHAPLAANGPNTKAVVKVAV